MIVALMQVANLVVLWYAIDAAKLDFGAVNYFTACYLLAIPFVINWVLCNLEKLVDSMIY